MDHAAKQRFSGEGEENKNQTIKATDAWYEELQKMPFVSSRYYDILQLIELLIIGKNGKTLNLLKASAKKINPNKRRKIIPLMGSIKDFHTAIEKESQANQIQSQQNMPNENFTIHAKSEFEEDEM